MSKQGAMIIFRHLTQYIFEALFLTFCVLFAAESLKEGIVTNYISFNWLLTLTLVFAIMVLVFGPGIDKKKHEKKGKGRRFVLFVIRHLVAVFFSICVYIILYILISNRLKAYFVVPWAGLFGAYISTMLIFKKND